MEKNKWVKEWMIFALCLGAGGHVALGLVLHASEDWPISQAWINGCLFALSFYVLVQITRSIFRFLKPKSSHP